MIGPMCPQDRRELIILCCMRDIAHLCTELHFIKLRTPKSSEGCRVGMRYVIFDREWGLDSVI